MILKFKKLPIKLEKVYYHSLLIKLNKNEKDLGPASLNNTLKDNKTNLTDPETIKNLTKNGSEELKDAVAKGEKEMEECWKKINDTEDCERSTKKYKLFLKILIISCLSFAF